MYARNIKTSGYKLALQNSVASAPAEVAGPDIDLFLSKPASALLSGPRKPLNLPVKKTPNVPWDDLIEWVAPQKFGAKTNDKLDDSAAIQQAIDSGASTVYLPRGEYHFGGTVIIRGNVRRIIGCKASCAVVDPLKKSGKPLFRFEDGKQPVVIMEEINTDYSSGKFFFMENVASRTLVLARLGINFQSAEAYHGSGSGEVFIEDVVGRCLVLRTRPYGRGSSMWKATAHTLKTTTAPCGFLDLRPRAAVR